MKDTTPDITDRSNMKHIKIKLLTTTQNILRTGYSTIFRQKILTKDEEHILAPGLNFTIDNRQMTDNEL